MPIAERVIYTFFRGTEPRHSSRGIFDADQDDQIGLTDLEATIDTWLQQIRQASSDGLPVFKKTGVSFGATYFLTPPPIFPTPPYFFDFLLWWQAAGGNNPSEDVDSKHSPGKWGNCFLWRASFWTFCSFLRPEELSPAGL